MSSDLLNAETEKRNQEYLQLRKEDAHRTENCCRRRYPDGDIKGSADGCWGFFLCYSNCKAASLFFPLFPLYLLSTRTAAKISFAEPLQQTIPNIPPGAVLLLQGDHQCCSRWPIQLLGFCIFIYNTRTNPLWTYYLTL